MGLRLWPSLLLLDEFFLFLSLVEKPLLVHLVILYFPSLGFQLIGGQTLPKCIICFFFMHVFHSFLLLHPLFQDVLPFSLALLLCLCLFFVDHLADRISTSMRSSYDCLSNSFSSICRFNKFCYFISLLHFLWSVLSSRCLCCLSKSGTFFIILSYFTLKLWMTF